MTNSTRKNGLPDRRFAINRTLEAKEFAFWQKYGSLIATALLGALAGAILTKSIWDASHTPLVSPIGSSGVQVVQEAQATGPFCRDVIGCIRDVGEELGKDNKTIMTMIRIARYESNFREKAKNSKSTASGVFQITAGTWYSNDCIGDKWIAEDNIRCAYKIQSKRGFQPWEVCNTGKAECY